MAEVARCNKKLLNKALLEASYLCIAKRWIYLCFVRLDPVPEACCLCVRLPFCFLLSAYYILHLALCHVDFETLPHFHFPVG